ncbi:hypothetical protein ERO13_D04G091716v2 [Gossypium hirsutum]|nr:hypothetical protein ERO13_D04G091716v2 [Gossypium hirsutum]
MVCTLSGTKAISNVLLVSEFDQNLLSIGQLLEKNYTIIFKDRGCMIFDSLGQEIVSVAINHRSFVLDWNLVASKAYTSSVDESYLWHKRLV